MQDLTALPASFAAGTTVKYTRSHADYPANDGWVLTVVLSGRDRLEVTGTPSGAAFAVTLPATETAKLRPGVYRWTERASKAGEAFTACAGEITVTPDVVGASVGDLLSQDEKELDLVNTAITKILTHTLQAFSIAGRQVEYADLEKLQARRAVLEARISRRKNGGRIGRVHRVAFR
jgi:hypothetical protein